MQTNRQGKVRYRHIFVDIWDRFWWLVCTGKRNGENVLLVPPPHPTPAITGDNSHVKFFDFLLNTFFKFQKQESRGGKYLKYWMLRQYHHTRNYIQNIQRHRSLLICFFFHFLWPLISCVMAPWRELPDFTHQSSSLVPTTHFKMLNNSTEIPFSLSQISAFIRIRNVIISVSKQGCFRPDQTSHYECLRSTRGI